MVTTPAAGGANAALGTFERERPGQVICTHGDTWVVDTLSRRIVRRRCRVCEALAEVERSHGA